MRESSGHVLDGAVGSNHRAASVADKSVDREKLGGWRALPPQFMEAPIQSHLLNYGLALVSFAGAALTR